MRRWVVAGLAACWCGTGSAGADGFPRQPGVDVQHYRFELGLRDDSDEIQGNAAVTVRFKKEGLTRIDLDLASASEGKGMTVLGVTAGRQKLAFTHRDDRLSIELPEPTTQDQEITIAIRYHGLPAAGLHIGPNLYGERTFFSESWPNRARHWLPTVDHPYDKATGELVVTAPAHYQVVANGQLSEETDLPGGLRTTRFVQSVSIATWLFALGVAHFAVEHAAPVRGVPLEVWVFPQDRERGFRGLEAPARSAIELFSERLGPFPYQKLANVEAAGVRGGMEHASAIFYGESNVANAPLDDLVVHEIAHQWFGDSVTESDWDEVWLSEGFATYLTLLHTEHTQGRDAFVAGLLRNRGKVLEAEARLPDTPILHRNLSDPTKLLNVFVYQKAGWVLHMLRRQVGNDRFWSGLSEYYRRYRDGNATSADFRRVMEGVSGQDLRWFFDQWLERPGVPKVEGSWRYDRASRKLRVELRQIGPGEPFRVPLDLGLSLKGGVRRVETVELHERSQRFELSLDEPPTGVVLDPDTWALIEPGTFQQR